MTQLLDSGLVIHRVMFKIMLFGLLRAEMFEEAAFVSAAMPKHGQRPLPEVEAFLRSQGYDL